MSDRKIRIRAGEVELEAELNDSETASLVHDALPIQARVQRWGEEIYFEIPVETDPAPDARDVMEVGELAYWPVGRAFCIFFGPTPASSGEEPRAAGPVNPLGRVTGDATALTRVPNGAEIRLARA